MLLISCPCAIGIAAPLAESRLIDALLSIGIVVRNRASLKLLGREDAFIFDKTGTITTKEFDLKTDLGGYAPIIKTMCLQSNHPIAKSLAKTLQGVPKVDLNTKEIMGKGIQANDRYFLGSPKWLGLDSLSTLAFLEVGKPPISIELEDHIRSDVPTLLSELKCPVHLFSGDRHLNVERVAKALNIQSYYGDMTPEEKKKKIETLPGIVAFVGDGINDAAALAAASISFVPLNGSDLSSQAADFLLTKDDLGLIQKARQLGRMGRKILRQNLFWAFFYNIIGLVLALFGYLTPILATLFMMLSSFFVILNSRRSL